MANIQHIAERIFRHVNEDHLPAGYAACMGAIIEAYDEDPDVHEWVDAVQGSAVEILIARMVRAGAWDDPVWLRDALRELRKEDAA